MSKETFLNLFLLKNLTTFVLLPQSVIENPVLVDKKNATKKKKQKISANHNIAGKPLNAKFLSKSKHKTKQKLSCLYQTKDFPTKCPNWNYFDNHYHMLKAVFTGNEVQRQIITVVSHLAVQYKNFNCLTYFYRKNLNVSSFTLFYHHTEFIRYKPTI